MISTIMWLHIWPSQSFPRCAVLNRPGIRVYRVNLRFRPLFRGPSRVTFGPCIFVPLSDLLRLLDDLTPAHRLETIKWDDGSHGGGSTRSDQPAWCQMAKTQLSNPVTPSSSWKQVTFLMLDDLPSFVNLWLIIIDNDQPWFMVNGG